ncbi:MAG: TetR/AcrR family transcriptional regulator [Oceanicaulis sp.]
MRTAETTRTRVLNTALDALPDHGFGGLSVGRLASLTGMSKSGLIARFGDVERLQIALVDHAAERFSASVIKPAFSASAKTPARLRALASAWLDWLDARRPCPLMQAAFESCALAGTAGEYARAVRARFQPFVAGLARPALGERAEAFAFSFEAIGLAAGLAALTGAEEGRARAEAEYDQVFSRYGL